jgi:phage-related protein
MPLPNDIIFCIMGFAATKPVVWMASSKKDLRAFPQAARRRAGYEVRQVQMGLEPTDWKPMRTVGEGACEIRVRIGGEHRLIYVARFMEAIYVLHVFEKKTQRMVRSDLELARARYRDLVSRRSQRGGRASGK